ncbi:MAG: nucleotidyl transferase AbiEii/AbiGii toxin family protein [Candidatus Micrarchaeota archaeon]
MAENPLKEKSVAALGFLEKMVQAGFDPLFKGGTCAQIFIPEGLQRLSIDLDIATNESEARVFETLEAIKARTPIDTERWKDTPDPNLPFVRYTITLDPQGKRTSFYLDVLFKEPSYATQQTALHTRYFDSGTKARTPTLHSILGDKLATLGPKTVGRKLENERHAVDYLKHVYDISQLLPLASNTALVFGAYRAVVNDQKTFRPKVHITTENSLEDLLDVAKWLTMTAQNPKEVRDITTAGKVELLKAGIDGISAYLTPGVHFGPNEARSAGGQIALVAKTLERESKGKNHHSFAVLRDESERMFKKEDFIKSAAKRLAFEEPEIEWQRLVATSPKAIAYWHAALFPEHAEVTSEYRKKYG